MVSLLLTLNRYLFIWYLFFRDAGYENKTTSSTTTATAKRSETENVLILMQEIKYLKNQFNLGVV